MTSSARPYRSVLYIPGSNERALEKARGLPVDAIIFDLEDAVAAEAKADARWKLARTLKAGGYGNRARLVRVNGLETEWGPADLEAFSVLQLDGILQPKVSRAVDVDAMARLARDLPIWAMIETPLAVMNAAEIAAHPRVAGLVVGTNDLAKELNSRAHPEREPLITSLQMCLLAARSHAVVCIDGVYNAFKDEEGLRRECEQGRDMGFDGKTLIHPAQIEVANTAFAPTANEIDLAQRYIAAFDAAEAAGKGIAIVDGKIVENLHIVTAQATLDKAAAITAMEV